MRASDVPTPSTEERCATSICESHEGPVLMAINAERRKQGIEPLSKLTVCLCLPWHLHLAYAYVPSSSAPRESVVRNTNM